MPTDIRADLFWVLPLQTPEAMVPAIREHVRLNHFSEETFSGVKYRLDHAAYSRDGIFTGTVYKARSNNLPSQLTGSAVAPLAIANGTDLGEPMCFAYSPALSAAAIQYSNTGPRHGRLRDFLGAIGFPSPIDMSPCTLHKTMPSYDQSAQASTMRLAL